MIAKMRLLRTLPLLAILALAGCVPASGSISGKVTFKDKPLPGGTVTFFSSDQKVLTAFIKSDGHYTIDKVAVGPVKITVSPPIASVPMGPRGKQMDPSKMGSGPEAAAPPASNAKPESFPEKFKDPEKSGLSYTVIPGKQEHNIELK